MAKTPASVTDAHCSRVSHSVVPDEQLYSADMDNRQLTPIIEVSEREGVFQVHADFTMLADAETVTVEFAQQGIIISGGSAERYVPIPTDAETEWASVTVNGAVARISVPTAGLGHRLRAITMW